MENLKKAFTTFLLLLTIFTAHAHPSNIIGFGLGQPYEISTVAATKEAESITLQYIIASNSNNELLLKTGDLDTYNLMYMLQTDDGLVVKSNRIESNKLTINLTDFAPATYLLIVSNGQVSKTFKVVKRTEINLAITMGK